MKYLYCPKCKELRIKPWYAFRNRCQMCFGDATVIPVPNSWMTYVSYLLYVLVPVFIAIYVLDEKVKTFLYIAVAGLIVMLVVAYADVVRGEQYARSKIKVTGSDQGAFRKRGWS